MTVPALASTEERHDAFYTYLRGTVSRGRVSMSTGIPKNLVGDWEVALAGLHCQTTEQFEMDAEELMFVMCAKKEHEKEFNDVRNSMTDVFHIHTDYRDGLFKELPKASLIVMRESDISFRKTPAGRFTRETYIKAMNEALRAKRHIFRHEIHLYHEKEQNNELALNWEYEKNNHRRVYFFPIFGSKSRRLLGIPEPGTSQFSYLINSLVLNCNVLLRNNLLPRPNVPVMIESNISEHNGVAEADHSCQGSTDGHVLKVVARDGLIISKDFNGEDRTYIAMQASVFSNIKIMLTAADSRLPLVVSGCVNVVLHMRPRHSSIEQKLAAAELRRLNRNADNALLALSQSYLDDRITMVPEVEYYTLKS